MQKCLSLQGGLALVAVLLTVLVGGARVSAQGQAPPVWQFENAGKGNLTPGCVTGMTLAGFEYGPDGRPVLAWREENGCGGVPQVYWTRRDNQTGAWPITEFQSSRRYQGGAPGDYAHQLSLRKSDGQPFLTYADVGFWNEINTYVSELSVTSSGGASTYLENLVGPQNCAGVNYSPAFGSGDVMPQWTTGLSLCNGMGPVRLNGSDINSFVYNARASLAIDSDGTRHVLWNSGSNVYYSRFPLNSTTPDLTTQLFDNINRFGGEVRIAVDNTGALHAIVRGPDVTADWDLGAIVYLTSTDHGDTWSSPEYVDYHDDPAVQQGPWNANSDLSLVVDDNGVPAVSFWRWQSELWYAKRDGGTWTQQRVTALPFNNQQRANQLRFDPSTGEPVIAFYDPAINQMRLARPAPTGVTLPADMSVTAGVVSPVTTPGALSIYTFIVTNNGVINVDAAEFSIRLPQGATVVSAQPPPGNDGRWRFPLTSGASATITVSADAPIAEGWAIATAHVESESADLAPANNDATAAQDVRADACFVPHDSSSGLIGWWRGDDSPLSNLVNRPDGVISGGVSYAEGVIGNAFHFNGSGGVRVWADDDNLYYPKDGSFTVQGYVKTSAPAGTIAARYECVSQRCSLTAWFFQVDQDGHLRLYLRNGPGVDQDIAGSRVVTDGVFHHVAFVIDKDANEVRLYVDGQVDASVPYVVGSIFESNGQRTPLTIGAYSDYWDAIAGGLTGEIDEFGIYNRALSAAELSQATAVATQPACGYYTPSGGADASVTVVPRSTVAQPLDNLTFDIGVRNVGNADLASVPMHVALSGGAQIIDASPRPDSATASTQEYEVGPLARGRWKWISIRVAAPVAPGPVSLKAKVTAPSDVTASNDTATGTINVLSDTCFVPSSLIGRWRANGNGVDEAGGRTAVLQQNTSYELGHAGLAFAFDGVGDHVTVDDAAALKPAQFTIAAWARPTHFTNGWQSVIAKGASGLDPNVWWYDDSYWIGFGYGGYPVVYTLHQGHVAVETLAASPVPAGKWYHLAATFDGSTVRLFVNGAEVAHTVVNLPLYYDSQNVPLAFGQDWQGGSPNGAPFGGLIDEITIHDHALTAVEIAAMIDGSTPGCSVPLDSSTPIRNGVPEARPQFNSVGMILPSATHMGCTATLIAPSVVLTAAQCLRDLTPNPVFDFSLGDGRTARVTDIRLHPLASTVDGFNVAFDIALASLDRAAVASWTDVTPATLRSDLPAPVAATAVGFGEQSGRVSGTLQITQYIPGEGPIGNFFEDGFLETVSDSADQMFCRPGTGGPLFVDDQIVGVASFRFVSTCEEEGPGYYVTTRRFSDWIHTTADELVAPPTTTTTIESTLNPAPSGEVVRFTATVTSVAGMPTGDVSFVYGPTNTTLATAPLFGGIAAFETGALPEGTFDIRATFTGNSSFPGSTASLTQVVAPAPSTPIRNGAPEARPPFNGVGMILPSATHMGCTATLIAPSIVLTAAQCLRDLTPNPVFDFSLGDGRTARVTDIRLHPLASTVDGFNVAFDIALASLDRAAVASWTDVTPATFRADLPTPGVAATALGFGAPSGRRSGTLQITQYIPGEGPIGVFRDDAFIEAIPGSSANQMFCFPGTGGPLFLEDQIVGIASFRFVATCAEEGPGYYVTTSRFIDWIHATTIELTNHPPTSNAADLTVIEGDPVDLRLQIMDADGDAVQYSLAGVPPGVVAVNEPSSIHLTGTPEPGSRGTYPYTLTMDDGTVTVVQSFTWTVRAPDSAPVAVNDSATVVNGDTVTIPVLANDSDPDGDQIRITSVGQPQFGEVQVSGDVRYRPTRPGWFTDSFTYTIEDRYGKTATATVTVRVLNPQADLSIAIDPPLLVVSPRQLASWNLVVTNQGAVPMNAVHVDAQLPAGFVFKGDASHQYPSFDIGSLDGGESRVIRVEALAPPEPGRVSHGASVFGDRLDPVEDNAVTAAIDVEPSFCFAPLPGMTNHWDFNHGFEDVLTGTVWQLLLPRVDSRLEQAVQLDGQTSFDLQSRFSSAFSLGVWLLPQATTTPIFSAQEYNGGEARTGFWLGLVDGHPTFKFTPRFSASAPIVMAAPAVNAGEWLHLALTYDRSVVRFFVNGVEAGASPAADFGQQLGSMALGSAFMDSSQPGYFSGLIDDLVVYDRALGSDEVLRMLSGDPVRCARPTTPAIALALSSTPSIVPTGALITTGLVITNVSDGYLEDVELDSRFDPLQLLGTYQSSQHIAAGPLLAGESRTYSAMLVTPDLDGHYIHHVDAVNVPTGFSASAEQVLDVAPLECFANGNTPTLDTCHINDRPQIDNPGLQHGSVGAPVALQIKAVDPDNTAPLRFIATGLPEGLAIDRDSGLITGAITPNASGLRHVIVTVTDSKLTASTAFDWMTPHRLSVHVDAGGRLLIGNDQFCGSLTVPVTCDVDVETPTQFVAVADHVDAVTSSWWVLDGTPISDSVIGMPYSRTLTVSWLSRFTLTLGNPGGNSPAQLIGGLPVFVDDYTSGPEWIACSFGQPDCVGHAFYQSRVMLLGLTTGSRTFDGFSGDCVGNPVCEFVLDRDNAKITANFSPRQYTLTLDVGRGGLVAFAGQTCDGGTTGKTCSVILTGGTGVTLQPQAGTGVIWNYQELTNVTPPLTLPRPQLWSAGVTVAATFALDRDRHLSVSFRAPLTLSLTGITGNWDGLLMSPGPGAPPFAFPILWGSNACGAFYCQGDNLPALACVPSNSYAGPCTLYFDWGSTVRMTPRVMTPFYLDAWSGACSGNATCTLQLDQAFTVVGTFKQPNRPPTVGPILDDSIAEDAVGERQLPFQTSDPDGDPRTLTFITNPPGKLSVAIQEPYVKYRVIAPNFNGPVVVTIIATDPGGLSGQSSFTVNVTPVNDPPTMDAIPPQTVAPSGTTHINLTGVTGGPPDENQEVTITVTASLPQFFGTIVPSGHGLDVTPVTTPTERQYIVHVRVSDEFEFYVERTFSLTVPAANTPVGRPVTVNAAGPGSPSPIDVTFSNVYASGQTTYTVQQGAFAPPDGFRFGTPPVTFDISTTALYIAPIKICIDYGSMAYINPAALRLFHYEGGRWVDRTVSIDTKNHIVCASVSSLSPFAIAEPEDLEGRMSGGGGLTAGGIDYRFDFHIAEKHIGDERGHLDLTITAPKSGKKKETRDEFKATEVGAINFWDDPAFTPGRFNRPQPQADSAVFTGRGQWNGGAGYTFEARVTDKGEPGRDRDVFAITIRDSRGAIVAGVDGTIDNGNIQSERLRPENWRH